MFLKIKLVLIAIHWKVVREIMRYKIDASPLDKLYNHIRICFEHY